LEFYIYFLVELLRNVLFLLGIGKSLLKFIFEELCIGIWKKRGKKIQKDPTYRSPKSSDESSAIYKRRRKAEESGRNEESELEEMPSQIGSIQQLTTHEYVSGSEKRQDIGNFSVRIQDPDIQDF